MSRIIVFAGTTEGRELVRALSEREADYLVCVASAYGEEVLAGIPQERVRVGRLDAEGMERLFRDHGAGSVVDATHPYAVQVSRNIREACRAAGCAYLRLLRNCGESAKTDFSGNLVRVESVREAAHFLAEHGGNALITTGSRELLPYASVPGFRERLTVRVLPSEESVAACRRAGFAGRQIIAMQGPFSEEMNELMLRETGAAWLVTKESGDAGGLSGKLMAAERAGAGVILIRRPGETDGLSVGGVLRRLFGEEMPRRKTVYLIGAGMGAASLLTKEAEDAILGADVLIGSGRLLQSFSSYHKPVFASWKSGEISSFLEGHPEFGTAAVLFSGDIGFYSGAGSLATELRKKEGWRVRLICGISSVQYFCAQWGIPWEDVRLISAHGREPDLADVVMRNRRVFVLAGTGPSSAALLGQLKNRGLGGLSVRVGVDLSGRGERLYETTVGAFSENVPEGLSVFLIENPEAGE